MASKNNKDSFAVDRPESSDNESDQEGKILETHIDYTKWTGEEKILIRYEENAESRYGDSAPIDPPKLNIKTPGYFVIEPNNGYKPYVRPPFPICDEVDEENMGDEMAIAASKTLDTVEEDDSESDDETATNKPDHLDLIDGKKDDADDESQQENKNE